MKSSYWAYRHVNGSIHLKRYRSVEAYNEAHLSPLCEEITDPFYAAGYVDARRIAREQLKKEQQSH
jgi:hypothetical protein